MTSAVRYNFNDISHLLLNAYIKVLKIDLFDESFEEIKVNNDELDSSHGYSNKISKWFLGFAKNGNVYEDDLEAYFEFTKIENIKKNLAQKDVITLRYRRRSENIFRWAKLSISKCDAEYNDTQKIVLLYIEDIDDDIKSLKMINTQKNIAASLVNMYNLSLYVDILGGGYEAIYISDEYKKFVKPKGKSKEIVDSLVYKILKLDDPKDFYDNFEKQIVVRKLKNTQSFDYEFKAKDLSGKEVWCRMVAIVVDRAKDGSPLHVVLGLQDVTEQALNTKHNNEILKDAFKSASLASNAKSEFMSRMSHDIRTPLNAIIGMTAIAGANIANKDRVLDCLSKITGASKHLLALINDILDLSKIEAGKVVLSDSYFNLSELLNDLLEIVHPEIEAHHHELIVYNKNIKHEEVIADNTHLEQIFINLITNAIKYTHDGGRIKLTFEEFPSGSPNIGFYTFCVEDNGYGMTPDFQKRMFEPFERQDDDRISKIQGTGLGMSIVRNLVNMMGGNIEVKSEVNKGTKITVSLKLKLQNNEELDPDIFLNLPVLVVDDDSDICQSTCCNLSELGFIADYSTSGYDAINKVCQRHNNHEDYYACLIDWQMPGMNGIETTRQIRKIVGPEVTIIIISAYSWEDIECEAREAGADAFISKPLFKSNLYETFKNLPKTLKQKENVNSLDMVKNIDMVGRRFLLVEDNDLNREIAKEILMSTGAEVVETINGLDAFNKFKESSINYFDMIFMDIQMPILNGYESTKKIRELPRDDAKDVPVIALTANAFLDDILNAKKAGMNAHVAKPIDFAKLKEVIEECIKKHED